MKFAFVGQWIFLLMLSSPFAWSATKPFVLFGARTTPENYGNRQEQVCFLRKHLSEHINFVVANVLPRGELEIADLLEPHSLGAQKFHVAFHTDYPDFYHFHLRYPNQFSFSDFSSFTNSNDFHLQYHSFEHLDLVEIQWLNEIRSLNDPVSSDWVAARLKKATASGKNSFGTNGFQSVPAPALAVLDKAGIDRLANLWHIQLAATSPGVDFLRPRVQFLNDQTREFKVLEEILKWRSVASHNNRYEVLPGQDLPNVWQPVDIFFARIEGNEAVAEQIRQFSQRNHQSWVGNFEGNHAAYLPVSPELQKNSIATFQSILRSIGSAPDPLNILKKVVLVSPPTSQNFTTAFAVSDSFIFALQYNLNDGECPELDSPQPSPILGATDNPESN